MALRTTVDRVKAVLSTSLTDEQVVVFIEDASRWVDEEVAVLTQLSNIRLEQIERYLACAWIRMRDLGLTAAKFGDINEQYQVDPKISEYLTTAAALDTTGTVRKYFLAPKEQGAVIAWRVATPYTEEVVEDETT